MQEPQYVQAVCGSEEKDVTTYCKSKLTRQQNFKSMVMRVKMQTDSMESESLFANNSGVSVEVSTATSFCVKILPDPVKYPIRSGLANGVEVLLDLETFDNGDQDVLGDGVNVLVTDGEDYSLTGLKGFPAGPGSAVDVKINPVKFTISESALKNFDYLDRKCVDTKYDLDPKSLSDSNYSLSNCLVAATLAEIYKR